LYSPNIPPHLSQLFTDALLLSTNVDELRAEMESSLSESPTYEDFLKHVKGKAKNKSPGITGLSINMIHCLPPPASKCMYVLLLTMWSHRYLPPWWKHHWITLVPKTTDIHVTLLKLRPICPLEVTRKIWSLLIIRKIIKVWTKYSALDDSQYAYLADRGTDSALLQVINASEEADELNTPLLFASFDVKRAFDSPPKK
jgi:hypothetical protein